jgi:serine/threonine-protein kinase
VLGVQRIGKYEVLDHLASGGMGQVYLARSTGLGGFERRVVVKTLDPGNDDDEAFVTMFLDEARLLGQLHHQYIAPIYEVGCDEDGRYYLVMDYVHGETAEAVWKRRSKRGSLLPQPFTLTIVSAVASALDYAHSLTGRDGAPLNVVHRDVSLSNVMVGYDGAVKLIDFGIAKAANRATKTAVGMLKGKLAYLAPEQILHKPIDHRTDIFALGIVLYELTTMTRAFRGESDLITLERITTGEFAPPSEVVPGYPAELEAIVMKAMRLDPDARYQSAGAMGRALEAFAGVRGMSLGHAAITGEMAQLFSEKRRRFARSSADVTTDTALKGLTSTPDPDAEITPVTPMQDLTPVTAIEPVHPIETEETTEPRELPAPPDLPRPPMVRFVRPPTITAEVPRIAQPSPYSGTALVRRPAPPRRFEPWWVAVGVFVLAVLVALLR